MVSRTSWRALALVATLGLPWTLACHSPSSPSAQTLNLDNTDSGRVVSVRVGDEIDVTLQTIGPGEYNEVPEISSAAVIFLKESSPFIPNPGGPRQLFQFNAAAVGRAVISIPHNFQDRRFELTVDVR